MSASRVTTAVIPAAGMGTRFLPATKSQPKELLPVVDKPVIQYAVEEAARAGLRDVVVVTGEGKRAIEAHFSPDPALERFLERAHKPELLAEVRATSAIAALRYVVQVEPLGLGHAVSVARDAVGDEGFAVLLPDDLIVDDARLLRTMLEVQRAHGGTVLALMEVAAGEISSYGCAAVEPVQPAGALEALDHADQSSLPGRLVRVRGLVEKPAPADAPSNLAVLGRYVFSPEIFGALDRIVPGAGGELQLTDAIALALEDGPVHGVIFTGRRYDVGNKVHFLRANVELALEREDLGPEVAAWLAPLAGRREVAD